LHDNAERARVCKAPGPFRQLPGSAMDGILGRGGPATGAVDETAKRRWIEE